MADSGESPRVQVLACTVLAIVVVITLALGAAAAWFRAPEGASSAPEPTASEEPADPSDAREDTPSTPRAVESQGEDENPAATAGEAPEASPTPEPDSTAAPPAPAPAQPAPPAAPQPAPPPAPAPPPPPAAPTAHESGGVLTETNAQRSTDGLGALARSGTLVSMACAWASEMAAGAGMVHNNTRPPGASAWAENIAAGYGSASSVVNGWMNSSGHRANILNATYTQMGSCYADAADGTRYWVQKFAG